MLELDQLRCGYGEVVAVESLSLKVDAGRITALLGPNGAGKTSTLMCIAGHVRQQGGRLRFEGEDLERLSPGERTRRGLAIVPEGRRIFPDLSVAENLLVGGYSRPARASRRNQERVYQLFPRLAERRSQRAGSLSGGEQQMLAMGRALMAEPRLLLVDEMSLGLMPAMVDLCFRALQEMTREGIGVLLVEQNTPRALAAADQVTVLVSGRSPYQASGEAARQDSSLVDSFLGLARS
jgi:branched-chain amino acid transport system ATP-binding protein